MKKIVITLIVVISFVIVIPASFAQEEVRPSNNPTDSAQRLRPTVKPTDYILKLSGTPERKTGSSSGAFGRLTDIKLRSCQMVSQNVMKRSLGLVKSVSEMERKFTSIITGVTHYYETKVVPTGVTLPNYDALVVDITTRQNAVTPLIVTAQADATNFSCTGESPSTQLKQFAADVQVVIKALQEYRTGIKNLIVAVRGLHIPELTNGPTEAPTAVPTATIEPSVTPIISP